MADGGSITFSTDPDTGGYPAVVDDAFTRAVQGSKEGGDATAQFFDELNQTSDFWGDLADGKITFAPGVDPQGNPVYMASNGNVEMRLAASYVDGGGQPGDVVGRATIATRAKTTGISNWTALAVRVATMPVYLQLTHDLFDKLLYPIYKNTSTVVTKLAARIQEQTRVETPEIDALESADTVTSEASEVVDDVAAEVGAEGVDYMSIEWGAVALDVAGLAPLMALPMIFEELGHTMSHSLVVQNLTGRSFTWDIDVPHGRTSLRPGQRSLPGLADDDGVTLSSSVTLQHVNTTDYSSIGFALGLHPDDGGPVATLVVDVPWAGDNTIWVGSSDGLSQAWERHSGSPDGLSTTAVFGDYQVTLSLNTLSGTSDDAYFYCSTAVLEPVQGD